MSTGRARTYGVFISYAHADEQWARWLHRRLERYRTPRRLVGADASFGRVPARLGPVFRDREDLATGGDLRQAVKAGLKNSESLVVICSPDAARSEWVNREITIFKQQHGHHRVFCFIVNGEPGDRRRECFPPTVLSVISADGRLTGEPVEPMAADARDGKDGRRLALMKLQAGLLGVDLDELRQREAVRRQQRLVAVAAASLAGMALAGWLAWSATVARDDAQRRQLQAEGLVDFMLTDLRERLDAVGRLDVLQAVGDEAMAYLTDLSPRDLSDDSMAFRARAMMLLGQVAFSERRWDDARHAMAGSRVLYEERVNRLHGDPQALFDLAQVVFWQGNIEFETSDATTAGRYLNEYLDLAERLVSLEPDRDTWRQERVYALTNLAAIHEAQNRPDEALDLVDRAVADMEEIVEAAGDRVALSGLADLLGWQSSIRYAGGDFPGALEARRANHDIVQSLVASAGQDQAQKLRLAWSYRGMAYRLFDVGHTREALEAAGQSEMLLYELTTHDPANVRWRTEWVKVRYEHYRFRVQSGTGVVRAEHLVELDGLFNDVRQASPEDMDLAGLHSNLLGMLAFARHAADIAMARQTLFLARQLLIDRHEGERVDDADHWLHQVWLDWIEAQWLPPGSSRRDAIINHAVDEFDRHAHTLDTVTNRVMLARLLHLDQAHPRRQLLVSELEAAGYGGQASWTPFANGESQTDGTMNIR